MLKHASVWHAIDRLAEEYGLSTSGLARAAGLDPTTFNKSKRTTRDGKLRWPSTESVAKILTATGANLDEFVSYVSEGQSSGGVYRNIPLIGQAEAGNAGYFDDGGFPTGGGWDEIAFPAVGDPHAYALEISGDSMVPIYRDGDIIVVAPGEAPRRGDRVVAKTRDGEVLAKVLARQTALYVELSSMNPAYEDRTIETKDLAFLARIVWASQ